LQKHSVVVAKIWNLMLDTKIESYKQTGKFVNTTPAQYKTEYPYLKEVDSLALANTQMNLQTAFANRFSKSRKKNNGFPKFKSAKRSRKSYTTNNQNGTVKIVDNGIRLPKIGVVKAVIHTKPQSNWKLKSATVSREADGTYYVSVLFEYTKVESNHSIDLNNSVGLDYKSDGLFVSSDGEVANMPHFYRKSQSKLAKEQRRLSRKQKDSNNYKRQQVKVAKVHRHIANQRKGLFTQEIY